MESKTHSSFASPSPDFLLFWPLHSLSRALRKRRPGASVLTGVLLLAVSLSFLTIVRNECRFAAQDVERPDLRSDSALAPSHWVRGPPKARMADNLLPDVKYISTFVSAGWTNDLMTYGNMLYLALLTQRIPVLGPFTPNHLSAVAGSIPFGDVFDVPHLAREMGWPVLEWRDVKDVEGGEEEELGCWSSWMGTSRMEFEPKWSWMPDEMGLDVSYTPVPYEHKMFPQDDTEPHLLHGKLMQLGFPSGRRQALSRSRRLPNSKGNLLEPSDHLMCFDQLYAVSVDTHWEWFTDSSPVWRFVGRHMKWNPKAEALAKAYLARHWGLESGKPIPPYISVHARRGDFGKYCPFMGGNGTSCLPSLRQLKRRVGEVQAQLLQKGVSTDRVLITSDEKDPAWWEEIQEAGYTWVDHVEARTQALFGEFAPILDAIFHSFASGFVGTDQSTFSLLAAKKVEEWNAGPTTFLRWVNVPEAEL